jgi:hypothetical protein
MKPSLLSHVPPPPFHTFTTRPVPMVWGTFVILNGRPRSVKALVDEL